MSTQTVHAAEREFTITRAFDAPVATVWEVWTRPEHFEQWFHAKPGSVELDVRPGGSWRATLDTPGGEMQLGGSYREVVERERLVWTMDIPGEPCVMHASFDEQDGRTVAVYGQNVVGPFSCDDAIAGATGILDSFEQHLGTVAAAA